MSNTISPSFQPKLKTNVSFNFNLLSVVNLFHPAENLARSFEYTIPISHTLSNFPFPTFGTDVSWDIL